MEGSWRKMCFSPALKWLKCSARASILWLNESGTISRGASFWCAGAWSQPASDQRSPASVWLKETRWDWLENLCNARAPAAAAHAPSQHSPRPKGRRKLGGWGDGLWPLAFSDGPPSGGRQGVFILCASSFFPHLISGTLQFSPSLGERQTIFTGNLLAVFPVSVLLKHTKHSLSLTTVKWIKSSSLLHYPACLTKLGSL